MNDMEKEESLVAISRHYGMPALMELVSQIVDRIASGVMSAPLDTDPNKASLVLYAERMKTEGARAVKIALDKKVQAYKTGEKFK